MACFVDEETEHEFIDVSSTSEGQEEGAAGGATAAANLLAPPHQAPIEVRLSAGGSGKPARNIDVSLQHTHLACSLHRCN